MKSIMNFYFLRLCQAVTDRVRAVKIQRKDPGACMREKPARIPLHPYPSVHLLHFRIYSHTPFHIHPENRIPVPVHRPVAFSRANV